MATSAQRPTPAQPAVQNTTATQTSQPQPINDAAPTQASTTAPQQQPPLQPQTLEAGQPQQISPAAPKPAVATGAQQPPNNIEPSHVMQAASQSKMIKPEDVKKDPPPQPTPSQSQPQQDQPHPASQPAKSLDIDDKAIGNYATSITGLESQKNTIKT